MHSPILCVFCSIPGADAEHGRIVERRRPSTQRFDCGTLERPVSPAAIGRPTPSVEKIHRVDPRARGASAPLSAARLDESARPRRWYASTAERGPSGWLFRGDPARDRPAGCRGAYPLPGRLFVERRPHVDAQPVARSLSCTDGKRAHVFERPLRVFAGSEAAVKAEDEALRDGAVARRGQRRPAGALLVPSAEELVFVRNLRRLR